MMKATLALLLLLYSKYCLGDSYKTDGISTKAEAFSLPKLDVSSTESATEQSHKSAGHKQTNQTHKVDRYQVVKIDFAYVKAPFVITAWIFVACCAKTGFHMSPKLGSLCPESCMLLLVGVLIGLVLYHAEIELRSLTPTVFFLFMLPPIVFDAGYFMPNRLFFDNIISILVYAVIGTVWNALSIGFTLWGIGLTGIFHYNVPLMDMLLFSSIVSAVDPVAVLAVFEEIHVNEVLYIIVFGESLLNDAVTVVLYHMFEDFTEMGFSNIQSIDYFSGVASFFVVSGGGTLIGIIFGFATSFFSRFTTSVPVIEPMVPFIMGYLAYLCAEIFHLSGILSLVFCGITMKNYVEENISHKSHVTVKYVCKMLATASETIIFVVLGVSTVNDNHEWDTWFVLCSIFFCSVYRAIGVMVLSTFLNHFRLHQINGVEQFIMSYGGLRGAVAVALALIIKQNVIPSKNMMVTTIIAVVYFTVFVQGMTIKFFVRILKVPRKQDREISMNERLHITVIDHLMGGIEEVADQFFGNHKIRDRFKYFNNKYLRRFLTKHSEVHEPKIFATHSKLNLMDAMNMVNSSSSSRLTLETDVSLSTVLRNYTQANLTKLAPDETPGTAPNPSPLLNIDMGELTYNPSFKDLADSEIHHILEDSMFKPPKRSRRYSRTQFYENQPKHPPFHHHMRMQIRRLVSESRRRRKKHKSQPQNNGSHGDTEKQPSISTIYLTSGRNHPGVTVTSPRDEDYEPDNGITFTAKSFSVDSSEVPVRTLTESVLPWKRDNDVINSDPARPQEEFPTWVDNRDYYPGYLSPTPTFIERATGRHNLSEADTIDEEDESFEIEETVSKPDRSSPSKSADEAAVDFRRQKCWSPTGEQRRWFFRKSSQKSPDQFSLGSIHSGDSPPVDTISIECPDVALDVESDAETGNTKL
uniref:Sodium/hydrogen exchanger n=1 Tax=Cupiennius salei TaxID=6928 RepID=A0A061QLJ2_CUPSA